MTNPPVQYTMPGTTQGGPLPQNLWRYYCHKAQADAVLSKVKSVVPNAMVTNDPYLFIGGASSLVPDVDIWRIVGTYNGGDVNEFAGDLFDRMQVPNVWVDKNPDSSVGGDQIHVQQYGQYTELSWRKVSSVAG